MTRTRRHLVALLVLLLWCAAGPGSAQPVPTPALPAEVDHVAAADEAARSLDYDSALKHLETAAGSADEARLAWIRRRQALYERLLGIPALIQVARDDPGKLVGEGVTRGGRALGGLLQLLELGVTGGAAIGNRRWDLGSLSLQLDGDQTRAVEAPEIAQVRLTWAGPSQTGWPTYWRLETAEILLHTGELLAGRPTWFLPVSVLSVREPGAEEDTDITVLPMITRETNGDDLVAELVLIGGPPALAASAPTPEEGTP